MADKKPRKAKTAPPANETKAEKFSRVVSRRLTEMHGFGKGIANCFDTNTYEYTPAQANKVIAAVDEMRLMIAQSIKDGGPKAVKAGISI